MIPLGSSHTQDFPRRCVFEQLHVFAWCYVFRSFSLFLSMSTCFPDCWPKPVANRKRIHAKICQKTNKQTKTPLKNCKMEKCFKKRKMNQTAKKTFQWIRAVLRRRSENWPKPRNKTQKHIKEQIAANSRLLIFRFSPQRRLNPLELTLDRSP